MNPVEMVLFVALPPTVMWLSGLFAAFRPPRPAVRGALLHLAAGVVFAVVAVELVPDLLREHSPIETVVGFALGVAAMLGLRSLTHHKEEEEDEGAKRSEASPEGEGAPSFAKRAAAAEPAAAQSSGAVQAAAPPRLPAGMLAGIAIDLVVDGLMIGIGFAAGAKEGRLLAVALTTELISLGLAVVSSMQKRGIARGRSLKVLAALALAFVGGAGLGTTLLVRLPKHWLAAVLSFGAAALLFLVTEELLTEAHEEKETPAMTAVFFLGFLAFLILGMVT